MRSENFNIQIIIDSLNGTCGNSIQSALDFYYPDMDEDDLTNDDLAEIDFQIMICEECGWWVETHELNSQNICSDCSGD